MRRGQGRALWAERWRRREASGDMIIVRYADDIIVGFQYETDARPFWDAMRERLAEYSLSLHPEKTRLIEFGRFAADQRARRGLGKPETFNFLGFTFICGRSRRGRFARPARPIKYGRFFYSKAKDCARCPLKGYTTFDRFGTPMFISTASWSSAVGSARGATSQVDSISSTCASTISPSFVCPVVTSTSRTTPTLSSTAV